MVGANLADLYFSGEYSTATTWMGPTRSTWTCTTTPGTTSDYDAHIHGRSTGTTSSNRPQRASWPPHSDAGVDNDGDSLYEWLAVTVYIEVRSRVTTTSTPTSTADWDYITTIEILTYLDAGIDSVVPDVPGMDAQRDRVRRRVSASTWTSTAESYVWLDDDFHETGPYYVRRLRRRCAFDRVPVDERRADIDGVIDGEWDAADVVDLAAADVENELEAYMLVMNNATHLFIAYDVVGDEYEDYYDFASVGFDNGNDGILVDGSEDQFMMYSDTDETYHYVYDGWWGDWEYDCEPFDPDLTDHAGLAGAFGFGPSPMYASDHRMFEMSIPLALLDVDRRRHARVRGRFGVRTRRAGRLELGRELTGPCTTRTSTTRPSTETSSLPKL